MSDENQSTLKPGPGKKYRWNIEHRQPNYHRYRYNTKLPSKITTLGYVVNWLKIIEYYRGDEIVAKITQIDQVTWEGQVKGMRPKRFTNRKECKNYVWDLIE